MAFKPLDLQSKTKFYMRNVWGNPMKGKNLTINRKTAHFNYLFNTPKVPVNRKLEYL